MAEEFNKETFKRAVKRKAEHYYSRFKLISPKNNIEVSVRELNPLTGTYNEVNSEIFYYDGFKAEINA